MPALEQNHIVHCEIASYMAQIKIRGALKVLWVNTYIKKAFPYFIKHYILVNFSYYIKCAEVAPLLQVPNFSQLIYLNHCKPVMRTAETMKYGYKLESVKQKLSSIIILSYDSERWNHW